mgnify:CR=1 FL=1|tara:strand:+ start:167 stop:283 length:117 start_codon:yes stop_codon:yes gene_type:complete
MYFGLVISFFQADPYVIVIIQDKNGDLVKLKIENNDEE